MAGRSPDPREGAGQGDGAARSAGTLPYTELAYHIIQTRTHLRVKLIIINQSSIFLQSDEPLPGILNLE